MTSNSQFKNRVVIITGAANGIGRCLALSFAAENAVVVLVDVDEAGLVSSKEECLEKGAADAVSQVIDVSNKSEVQEMADDIYSRFGRIDILVNNAGIMIQSQPFEDTSEEVWKRTIDINLFGVVHGCQAVIPYLKRQGYGRIINAASLYGLLPQFESAPYSISKAGVISLTRILASELAPFGVTVNAYAPGIVKTELSAHSFVGERGKEKMQEIPLGRPAEPIDIARAVLFLASGDADYITGTTLVIDGGASSVMSPLRVAKKYRSQGS